MPKTFMPYVSMKPMAAWGRRSAMDLATAKMSSGTRSSADMMPCEGTLAAAVARCDVGLVVVVALLLLLLLLPGGGSLLRALASSHRAFTAMTSV